MPIYEYQCTECGHQLEVIQKVSEEPLTECPSCATTGLRKLVSAAAFRLKGGGWYETDFKQDNRRNVVKSDAESAGAGKQEKSETKSEAKKGDKKPASSTSSSSSDSGTKAKASG